MAYSVAWNEAAPIGASVTAATIDTELQNLKKSVRERMNDILQGTTSWETDATDPKKLLSHAIAEPRVSVTMTGSQSISDSTLTAAAWNSESYDSDGMHDNATNNSRLTIVAGEAGIYVFGVVVLWASDSVGYRELELYKNGVFFNLRQTVDPTTGQATSHSIVFPPLDVAVADYFEIFAWQSSGGALNLIGSLGAHFWAYKIGD